MSAYLEKILLRIPQILSQIDREPFSLTYGSGDRVYWCWKFTDFPGARFQEFTYTLSWLYSCTSFENKWKGNKQLLDQIEAGFNYWSKIQYKNGSFDEAYPYENSLAATAFTTFYLSEAFELVKDDLDHKMTEEFLRTLQKASQWLTKNDETHGVLSNHLATAAAGLYNAGLLLNDEKAKERSQYFVDRIYKHQSAEGWYEEYGGADIGYQTHGSFYLAKIWQKSNDENLLESLKKANEFIKYFIHPDGSIGGEYGSRDTMFYYPAAYEILSGKCDHARNIASYQHDMISKNNTVGLEQMDAYNLFPVLNNYIFAHEEYIKKSENHSNSELPHQQEGKWEFPEAGIYVNSTSDYYAIIGAKKGGVTRIWNKATQSLAFQSCGYVYKKQICYLSNQSQGSSTYQMNNGILEIEGPFIKVNRKVFTPWLFIAFRIFTLNFGKIPSLAYWVKKLLVKTLVNKKKASSELTLNRRITFTSKEITIEDKLSNPNAKVVHIDKFSTIHMGSSRYIHMDEEMIRGREYPNSTMEFNANGVLEKAIIKFK